MMNQSSIGITLDIIDYYPEDFDYSSFSFLFISEENNFEREISFMNANQICHKINITNKKEIKYTIKILKENNFIGITEFIIPHNIIYRKEKIFDKICSINISDSTKKILFKNLDNNISLKIRVHSILQYLEENKGKNNINNRKIKKEKEISHIKKANNKKGKSNLFSSLARTENNFPILTNSSSSYKNKFNINTHSVRNNKNNNNNKLNNYHRKADSFILENNSKIQNIKKHKRTHSSEKQENNIKKLKNIKNKILAVKETKITKPEIDKDIIDINISNNSNNNINEIKNDLNKYIKENETKINNINNIDDMIIFTNNNIKYLLDNQKKNYDLIKKQINKINDKNNQYINVKQKINQNLHKKNQIIEKINNYETGKEMLILKEKMLDLKFSELSELKNDEFHLINDIYNNMTQTENNKENITNKNEKFLLLFKVLKLISKKNGPLQNLLTQTNSIESQRVNLKNIINKFKSELGIKEY